MEGVTQLLVPFMYDGITISTISTRSVARHGFKISYIRHMRQTGDDFTCASNWSRGLYLYSREVGRPPTASELLFERLGAESEFLNDGFWNDGFYLRPGDVCGSTNGAQLLVKVPLGMIRSSAACRASKGRPSSPPVLSAQPTPFSPSTSYVESPHFEHNDRDAWLRSRFYIARPSYQLRLTTSVSIDSRRWTRGWQPGLRKSSLRVMMDPSMSSWAPYPSSRSSSDLASC